MDFFRKAAEAIGHLQDDVDQNTYQTTNSANEESQGQSQYHQRQPQTEQQAPPAPVRQQVQQSLGDEHDDDPGFKLPSQALAIIDKYVDTFQPGIAKGVADEIVEFERATIAALEEHIKAAIIGVFKGDFSEFQSNKNIGEFRAVREQPQGGDSQRQYGADLPQYNYPSTDVVASRGGGGGQSNLPEYGSRGLPFAGGGVSGMTQQMSNLRVSNSQSQPAPEHERNIFQSALGKVADFAKDTAEDVSDGIEGELKEMAMNIGDIADHIEDKVAEIAPELKEKIGKILEELHLGLAEKMSGAALTQVKRFLGGNISLEDITSSAMEGVEDLLDGFTGNRNGVPKQEKGPGGAAGLLSDKLSSGLTRIRGHSRHDFRDFLSKIEEGLFNSLPDSLKDILSKIFGGNPFEASDKAKQSGAPPEKEGIFAEIGDKIKAIMERIQNALRDRVLEVVGGGHRRLEDKAWGNVQDAIVVKVQHYVPDIQVHLQDAPDQ